MSSKRRSSSRKNSKKQKRSTKKYIFKRSSVPPKRSVLYGGVVFPASITNQTISNVPAGSFLPHNNYAGDPNYLAVSSRNVPMIHAGGKRKGRQTKRKGQRGGGLFDSLGNTQNIFTSQPEVINRLDQVITNIPGVGLTANALMGRSIPIGNTVPNRPLA